VTWRIIIRPEAEGDIAETREWYEERQRGLSLEFRSALDDTMSSIAGNPELYARIYRNLRRALVARFPFAVFYVLRKESIIVIAVLHTSRSPALWRNRLKKHV
jgi:plasmid stabilization system protein ParE